MTLVEGGEAFGEWEQGEELTHGANRGGALVAFALRHRKKWGREWRPAQHVIREGDGGWGRHSHATGTRAERASGEQHSGAVLAAAAGMDMTRAWRAVSGSGLTSRTQTQLAAGSHGLGPK
jgi:hypothetical protein